MVFNHPRWRVRSQHDDMTWLGEIGIRKVKGPAGLLLRTFVDELADAAARGIADGRWW